ncbi:hypothetical protein BDC45DRAFT_558753 [Circinella umbellata]|nr:hypothetical protein BDC45DRAFT_558753 [Circinella umbellata]
MESNKFTIVKGQPQNEELYMSRYFVNIANIELTADYRALCNFQLLRWCLKGNRLYTTVKYHYTHRNQYLVYLYLFLRHKIYSKITEAKSYKRMQYLLEISLKGIIFVLWLIVNSRVKILILKQASSNEILV